MLLIWLGAAGPGKVRLCQARQGMARHGRDFLLEIEEYEIMRRGQARQGKAWQGTAWRGAARQGRDFLLEIEG